MFIYLFVTSSFLLINLGLSLYCDYFTPFNIGDKVITRAGTKGEVIYRNSYRYQISGYSGQRYVCDFINFWELKKV